MFSNNDWQLPQTNFSTIFFTRIVGKDSSAINTLTSSENVKNMMILSAKLGERKLALLIKHLPSFSHCSKKTRFLNWQFFCKTKRCKYFVNSSVVLLITLIISCTWSSRDDVKRNSYTVKNNSLFDTFLWNNYMNQNNVIYRE